MLFSIPILITFTLIFKTIKNKTMTYFKSQDIKRQELQVLAQLCSQRRAESESTLPKQNIGYFLIMFLKPSFCKP